MTRKNTMSLLAAVALAFMTASCREIFTTSLGSSLARDSVSISKDTSMDDLLDIANTNGMSDPDVAKELLDVLAGKDRKDLLDMSDADKKTVLDLATSACIDLDSLTGLVAKSDNSDADPDKLAKEVLDSFDTSVDLTAVEVLLGDPETVATAPVETVVLATASVVADVADEVGSTETVMGILDAPDPASTPEYAALTASQQERIDLVLEVRAGIKARPDSNTKVAGVDISDLLGGNS
jgi:hypothetical protein